jgi:hypothetical protein
MACVEGLDRGMIGLGQTFFQHMIK